MYSHSKKVLGSGSGPFCVDIACFPCVLVGSFRVLQLSPIIQIHASWFRLLGDFKLPIGVNLNLCGLLPHYVSPVMN